MQRLYSTGHVVNILQNTLRRLEQKGSFDRDDPAFIHLRRRLILAIAELEEQRDREPPADRDADVEEPITLLRLCRRGQPQCRTHVELCLRG